MESMENIFGSKSLPSSRPVDQSGQTGIYQMEKHRNMILI